jgi:hypothetical protein
LRGRYGCTAESGPRGVRVEVTVRFIRRLAISSRIIIRIIRFGRLPIVRMLRRGEGRLAPLTTRNGDRRLTLLSGGRLRGIVNCVRRVSLDATRSKAKSDSSNFAFAYTVRFSPTK